MARKFRVQYPDAIYHVMNRADHREAIFRSVKDRELFIQTLGQVCERTDLVPLRNREWSRRRGPTWWTA